MVSVKLWGTRGSLASPGPETMRYGGNTACVEVRSDDGTVLVLDAGTGIRRLGKALSQEVCRIDMLLTHLHMDHIQGLGFFLPLRKPDCEIHIWGPASTTRGLRGRLTRYLSPPLFPVHLRDLEAALSFHEVPCGDIQIGPFTISSALVCHPDPTVGFRIAAPEGVVTYLPDHEPALGVKNFPMAPDWTSGYELAADADLLIHDAQYTAAEYESRVGWGHSSLAHAFAFARLARVQQLVPFHHEPTHSDRELDRFIAEMIAQSDPPFRVTPGVEDAVFELRGA